MVKFGGADRVRISKNSHAVYKLLCDREKIFPQYKDLFQFAAAIGIRLKKREPFKREVELGRITGFDTDDIFETLLKELHPEADGVKRLKLLEEYAEAGIRILKERYDRDKKIDIEEIIRELESHKDVLSV
ncbi:MAG: hypothetical protein DRN25_02055 [Thermoplasmata archaeon]|nr:MAG: hypothetical protein DRN25_02055 [Thermoplasmata archaeon]